MKLAFLLLFLSLPANGADYHIELTPDGAKINWTLGGSVHTVHGTFKLKRGDVRFDPDTGKANGSIVVDATSGASGSDARDSKMHRGVIESEKYGEVSFSPDRVDGKVDVNQVSSVKLHGVFAIHGATHEMTIPVQLTPHGKQLTANLQFDVPYVAWGMKDPSNFLLKVGKSVHVEVEATGRISPDRP